jgi:gas vesicle protein
MEIRKTEIKKGDIIKMNDLKNLLQDTPENTKENSELLVSKAKERVKETIDRYTDKIQEIQKANDADKQKLQNELADIQKQLKAEKESYQQARNNFFADISKNFQNFSEKDLKKLPIRLIRYKQKEGLLNKPEGFNSISAIRRRKTIDTLIKKINLIDKDHTKGMNFVL